MFWKTVAMLMSLFLIAGSSAALVLDMFLQGKAEAEKALCKWLICASDSLVRNGYRARWVEGSSFAAVDMFREALRRDPASAGRWCDLGEVLLQAGDVVRGRRAMETAGARAPYSPAVLLRTGAFYTELGDTGAARRQMALVLKLTDAYDALIFSQFRRFGYAMDSVYAALEGNRRAAEAYFRFLLSEAQPEDVESAWRLLRRHYQPDEALLASYVDYLLGQGRNDAALEVWSERFAAREPGYPDRNLVCNGDFEFEPTAAGLDWRIAASPHASAVRDRGPARSGSWCLRVDFDGRENLNYENIAQFAVVNPGCFAFSAYLKTENITTDEGPRFRISDEAGRLDIETEDARGTSGWRRVEKRFRVPPGVRRIKLQVIRKPSQKFDNKIAGTCWIDRVQLAPEPCRAERPK